MSVDVCRSGQHHADISRSVVDLDPYLGEAVHEWRQPLRRDDSAHKLHRDDSAVAGGDEANLAALLSLPSWVGLCRKTEKVVDFPGQ
jgi:hypothetical protein